MENKKLIITGGDSQTATEYMMSDLLDWECVFLSRSELDITNINRVRKQLKDANCVLNLAAYTNVEGAEDDEDSAYAINSIGPKNLAIVCHELNIPLIHISTDYVFDGKKETSYLTDDETLPLNIYGKSKLLGETLIAENHDWYYIIRTSWIYRNGSKNFYTTMLKLAQERSEVSVVSDQTGSPTSIKELCRAIDSVIKDLDKEKSGVYHFTGLGKTTWKDFAEEIFYQCRISIIVNGITTDAWKSKLVRPKNSYLDSSKFIETFNYIPAHWKNALREVIGEIKMLPIKVGDIVIVNDIESLVVETDYSQRIAKISPNGDLSKTLEISFDLLFL
jgi:dTDP-4-dehydrorhamnose reductase